MKSGFFKLGDALFEHSELFFCEGVFRRLRLGEMGERAYYLNVGALVKGVDDLLKLLSRPGSDPVQPRFDFNLGFHGFALSGGLSGEGTHPLRGEQRDLHIPADGVGKGIMEHRSHDQNFRVGNAAFPQNQALVGLGTGQSSAAAALCQDSGDFQSAHAVGVRFQNRDDLGRGDKAGDFFEVFLQNGQIHFIVGVVASQIHSEIPPIRIETQDFGKY